MKLDAELLHRLVTLRLHLAGVGEAPVALPGRDGTIDFALTDDGSRLHLDTVSQSAEIFMGGGESGMRSLGGVDDLSDPERFASILHNVDVEMARRHGQVTNALTDLADSLALCDDEEVGKLVDETISAQVVEALPADRTVTETFVDFARLVEQSNVDEMCVLTWDVLTTKARMAPFDHGKSLASRTEYAQSVADRSAPKASFAM